MIKRILSLLLMLLGGYGMFWWHDVLWSSGGPDLGRNTFQYVVPYFITSALIFIGLFSGMNSVKNGTKIKKL